MAWIVLFSTNRWQLGGAILKWRFCLPPWCFGHGLRPNWWDKGTSPGTRFGGTKGTSTTSATRYMACLFNLGPGIIPTLSQPIKTRKINHIYIIYVCSNNKDKVSLIWFWLMHPYFIMDIEKLYIPYFLIWFPPLNTFRDQNLLMINSFLPWLVFPAPLNKFLTWILDAVYIKIAFRFADLFDYSNLKDIK